MSPSILEYGVRPILRDVASRLPYFALLRLSATCKSWAKIALEDDLWERLAVALPQCQCKPPLLSWRETYRECVTSRFTPPKRVRHKLHPELYLKLKIIMLGDLGVGKSSFMRRFGDDEFDDFFPFGAWTSEFKSKYVGCAQSDMQLMLWDIEERKLLCGGHLASYLGIHGVLIMYDISDRKSFERCEMWKEEARRLTRDGPVAFGLVGCKSDLSDGREVAAEEGAALAEKWSAEAPSPRGGWSRVWFTEASAKTGEAVSLALARLAKAALTTPAARNAETAIADKLRELQAASRSRVRPCIVC